MASVLAEGIVEIIRLRRLQRRLDGGNAGVRDRRGGQPFMEIGIEGRVDLQLILRQRRLKAVAEPVDLRGVDLQPEVRLAAAVETVVDEKPEAVYK